MTVIKKILFFITPVFLMLLGMTSLSSAQTVFEAQLSGSNETNPITSAAYGEVTATLTGNQLVVSGSFEDLSSDLATSIAGGAHIHAGMAGESGPVLYPITVTTNADNRSGTIDETISLTDGQVDTLMQRGLYVNIHSENHMAGELRAQLLPESEAYYRANLSGAFEVPASKTMASGAVNLELRGDSLFVSGTFSGLESEFDANVAGGSHLHIGPAGSNGAIAIGLNADLAGDNLSGKYFAADNAYELTLEQRTALMNRDVYVNIHTTGYAGGELRGQVVPAATTTFFARLSGSSEVPAVNTTGTGAVVVELREGQVTASGSFANLTSEFDPTVAGGAHLHIGNSGENGAIVFGLTSQTEIDLRSGTFASTTNQFSLGESQVQSLLDRNFYVNIHTVDNQGGELRGQVMGDAVAYFHTNLAGIHEVQPVMSSGQGAIDAEYNGSVLIAAGGFSNLPSEFDASVAGGAHLHTGPVSGNGAIDINLNSTLDAGNMSGTFDAENNIFEVSDEQLMTFYDTGYYANIHTTGNAAGELRGQIVSDPNSFPEESTIMFPSDGTNLALTTDASTTFTVNWDASSDSDGNEIAYVWQLSTDADFENIVVNTNTDSSTEYETTYGELDNLLATAGVESGNSRILYHRVVATDGSDDTYGDTYAITLQRPNINIAADFVATLSGSNETNPVTTTASGKVTASLDGTTLTVEGNFDGLSSDIATSIAGGAHLHTGMAGESGPVIIPLDISANADNRSGSFMASSNTYQLTSGQVDTLMKRGFYVNIHSMNHQAGELRSQLLPVSDAYFRTNLSGAFEEPASKSMGSGAVNLELRGDSLFVSGSFSGLESAFDVNVAGGSHLHIGPAGSNGAISIGLNAELADDNLSGKYFAADNAYELNTEQKEALMHRNMYVNIHTMTFAGGELRGQVVPAASTTFFAQLSGTAEIPSVNTDAAGATVLELHGDTLIVSGSFTGLQTAFNVEIAGGSHLHFGHAGENGDIGFSLSANLDTDLTAGVYSAENNMFELSEEQIEMLLHRNVYVNIHSLENPGGELRGQALGDATAYFQTNLAGIHEVQPIMSSASGAAVIEYSGGNIIVSGGFQGLSAPVDTDIAGGAHLHAGPVTSNGAVEIPLGLTLSDSDTVGVFAAMDNMYELTAEQESALFEDGTYVNVHTTNFAGGELRGQTLFAPNMYPEATSLTGPAEGEMLTVQGESTTKFEASWEASSDPDGQDVAYIWQLSTEADFSNIVVNTNVGSESMFTTTFGSLDSLLSDLGVQIGGTTTVYHRVVVTDGSNEAMSMPRSAVLERGTITSNEDEEVGQPNEFALNQNYPNPFNPTTNISFSLSEASQASITIYNMLGQQVAVLASERFAAGQHSVKFDAAEFSSGIYIYRLQAEGKTITRQMTLIK